MIVHDAFPGLVFLDNLPDFALFLLVPSEY
jgi:hypothetical protein